MAYSKNDFFHWDRDIDLDLLLGEYTNSEFEIDLSDEEVVTADRNKVTTSGKKRKTENTDKQFKCSECDTFYSSVTGIRGHVQKKHGITRVRGKYLTT